MPLEVWCQILFFLPGVALARAEAVCKLWREVIRSPQSRFWSGAVRREYDGSRMDHVSMAEPLDCALPQSPSADAVIPFPWSSASQEVWKEEYRRRHIAAKKRCCACSADIGRNFMLTPHRSRPAVCAHCAPEQLLKLSAVKKMISAAGGKASKLRHGLGNFAVSEFYLSNEHTAFGCTRAGYYCLRWEVSALCEQLARGHAPKQRRARRPRTAAPSKHTGTAYLQKVHSIDDFIKGMREKNSERSIEEKLEAARRAALLERQKEAMRTWTAACKENGISPAYKDISAIARSALDRCIEGGDAKDKQRLRAVAEHIRRRQEALARHLRARHGLALGSIATWPPLGCREELGRVVDSLAAKSTPGASTTAASAIANMAQRELELQAACVEAGIVYSPLQWTRKVQAIVLAAIQGPLDGAPGLPEVVRSLADHLPARPSHENGPRLLGKRCSRD